MNCPICKNPVSPQQVIVENNVSVCMTCFFDDSIPNATSYSDKDVKVRQEKKKEAIRKRSKEIMTII
jgi:hypothetical protein